MVYPESSNTVFKTLNGLTREQQLTVAGLGRIFMYSDAQQFGPDAEGVVRVSVPGSATYVDPDGQPSDFYCQGMHDGELDVHETYRFPNQKAILDKAHTITHEMTRAAWERFEEQQEQNLRYDEESNERYARRLAFENSPIGRIAAGADKLYRRVFKV